MTTSDPVDAAVAACMEAVFAYARPEPIVEKMSDWVDEDGLHVRLWDDEAMQARWAEKRSAVEQAIRRLWVEAQANPMGALKIAEEYIRGEAALGKKRIEHKYAVLDVIRIEQDRYAAARRARDEAEA